MKKTGKIRKVLKIGLLIWITFFVVDFSLAQMFKPPIFAVHLIKYKDGGSAEYYGLGYKVNKYVDLSAEDGPRIVKVDFGTWSMKFSKP